MQTRFLFAELLITFLTISSLLTTSTYFASWFDKYLAVTAVASPVLKMVSSIESISANRLPMSGYVYTLYGGLPWMQAVTR